MYPTPYVASLRLYEPISTFEFEDQIRWAKVSNSSHTGLDEQYLALTRLIRNDFSTFKTDGAYILDIESAR